MFISTKHTMEYRGRTQVGNNSSSLQFSSLDLQHQGSLITVATNYFQFFIPRKVAEHSQVRNFGKLLPVS